MEELIKSFQIGFLLRSFFSGIFFVISYYVASGMENNPAKILNITSENALSIGLPFSIVAGVIVYGLHRSLLYPLFEWGFNSDLAKRLRKRSLPLISRNTIKNLLFIWDGKTCADGKKQMRAKQLETWADYIHHQFVSAWCVIFGAWIGALVKKEESIFTSINGALLTLAIVFLCAAIFSNWRELSVEDYVEANP